MIRNNRLLAKFGGCATCFAPQAWCNRLEEKDNTGLSNRGDWRPIGGKELCQFDEVLLSECVVSLTMDERSIPGRNLRMEEKGLDRENVMDEARFLGFAIEYGGLETNGLVKELIEI